MSGEAGRWIDRWLGWITLICIFGTCLCFIGLAVLQSQVRGQAKDGAVALARSCKLAAVSKKVYLDTLERHVITDGDYRLFVVTLKQACSRRPH